MMQQMPDSLGATLQRVYQFEAQLPAIGINASAAISESPAGSLTAIGATVCVSMLELTLHWSPVVCLVADVAVLPLHTRRRHRQHAMTCLQHYP
jgi:hypothetical protein